MLRPASRLFGRLHETAILADAYARIVATHRSEMALLSGPPGIGKSSLVQRFHTLLRVGRHRFAMGKCEKAQRQTIAAPILRLLRQLVDMALTDGDASLALLRGRIAEEVGGPVRAIIDLLPDMEILAGRMPTLPELPIALAQARLQRSLLAALGAFARAEQPLILFVDDLQWADPATLSLLKAFAADAPPNILLVMSYRDDGVASLEAADGIFTALRSAPLALSEIALDPLDLDASRALLASTLETSGESISVLADVIHDQARGNPFFIEHFLRRLHEEGILTRDEESRIWSWDQDRLGEVRGGGDVLDFIAGRLARLGLSDRALLAAAALLGGHGDIPLLASLLRRSKADVEAAAASLAEAGLLTLEGLKIGFPHDRILEAASQLAPRADRPAIHGRIARHLITRWRAPRPEQLFVIASHVMQALAGEAALRLNPGTGRRFASILRDAAQQARAAAASEQAGAYLDVAAVLVGDRPSGRNPTLGTQHSALGNGIEWWISSRPLLTIGLGITAVPVQTAAPNAPDQSRSFTKYAENVRIGHKRPFE